MLLPLSRGGVGCTGMEPPDPRGGGAAVVELRGSFAGGMGSWRCERSFARRCSPLGAQRGPSRGKRLFLELRGIPRGGNGLLETSIGRGPSPREPLFSELQEVPPVRNGLPGLGGVPHTEMFSS